MSEYEVGYFIGERWVGITFARSALDARKIAMYYCEDGGKNWIIDRTKDKVLGTVERIGNRFYYEPARGGRKELRYDGTEATKGAKGWHPFGL